MHIQHILHIWLIFVVYVDFTIFRWTGYVNISCEICYIFFLYKQQQYHCSCEQFYRNFKVISDSVLIWQRLLRHFIGSREMNELVRHYCNVLGRHLQLFGSFLFFTTPTFWAIYSGSFRRQITVIEIIIVELHCVSNNRWQGGLCELQLNIVVVKFLVCMDFQSARDALN